MTDNPFPTKETVDAVVARTVDLLTANGLRARCLSWRTDLARDKVDLPFVVEMRVWTLSVPFEWFTEYDTETLAQVLAATVYNGWDGVIA